MRLPVSKPAHAEGILLGFTAFAVLWRGGKSLDGTWILAGVAALCAYSLWNSRSAKGEPRRVPWRVWGAAMGFLLWTLLSFFFSRTQNYGLDEALRDGSLILVFFWAARRSAAPEGAAFIRRFGTVFGGAVLAACVAGLAVYTLQPVNRFVGTFFDYRFVTDYWPNAWAELLLLAWPLVVLRAWNAGWKGACAVAGFLLGCLLLSYSRGAFLCFLGQGALLVGIGGIGILRREGAKAFARSWSAVRFAACAAVLAAVVFTGMNWARAHFHAVESVARKATFTADEGRSSVDERRLFWAHAIELAREKPLTGWGPYSFRFVQPRLQTGVYETSDHPHNAFLKLAMERGIPAAAFFGVLLLLVLVPAGVRLLARPRDAGWALRLALVTGIAGVLAHNLIDYNLQFVGIALPLWIMLGILVSGVSTAPARYQRTAEILTAVLLLCTAIWEGQFLVLSSLGRHAERMRDLEGALAWYRSAGPEVFSRDMHLGRASILLAMEKPDEAQSAISDYMAVNAEDARGWKLQGDIARAQGEDDAALAAYTQAWEYGRYNYPSLMTEIALLLEKRQDPSRSLQWKEDFVALQLSYSGAIMQNTHFIALSDAVEEFQRATKVLDRLYPGSFGSPQAVVDKAETERKKFGGRQRGMLW